MNSTLLYNKYKLLKGMVSENYYSWIKDRNLMGYYIRQVDTCVRWEGTDSGLNKGLN